MWYMELYIPSRRKPPIKLFQWLGRIALLYVAHRCTGIVLYLDKCCYRNENWVLCVHTIGRIWHDTCQSVRWQDNHAAFKTWYSGFSFKTNTWIESTWMRPSFELLLVDKVLWINSHTCFFPPLQNNLKSVQDGNLHSGMHPCRWPWAGPPGLG